MSRMLQPVDAADLPEYPLDGSERLESHWFMTWERRRWLNSDMRLRGTPECRAHYFDLICLSFDHSPIGTLPDERTANNAVRHQYRVLSEEEKLRMQSIKDPGAAFIAQLHEMGGTDPNGDRLASRDLELAQTHAEDAVMRAVRHITR
ncbi:MAG: hypothetical protein ACLFTP_12850 [Rhodosalinus sp.]